MKRKGKKFSLLLTVIISIFFISLFTLPSFATSYFPGDFVGPMGNLTPDGKVDFNDLMVFATAYGSITGDPNWNPLCDICGYLGDPDPDGKVNFDDLMVFATNFGKEIETIIPDTTKIIDQETEQVVTSVSEDQSTMVLSCSTPQTDSIEVGDIIIMGVTEQTPYGLLRKVTGVNKGATKYSPVYFYLGFGTLEEAVEKGRWEYTQTLKPEDIEKGFVFPEGIQPAREKISTTLDFGYSINDILYDQDNDPATTDNNITATGYIAFDYQVTFDGEIDGHTLKHFIFENVIETDSELNISVGASVSIADLADVADVTIGEPIPFTPVTVYIPTPLGPFPLVFFPSIELKVGIEGEAHIVLDVGITQTTSYTAGIEFTDGDWQNITDPLPNIVNHIKLADPKGTIYVTAHAGPQLNCKLYKTAGPYCNIFGYLYFDADTTLNPWWDLDAGLTVSAGVKMDVLSFHWDSGERPLFDFLPRFDVDDADGPYGGTESVHNLTKDTYYNTIQAALDDAANNNTIEVSDGTYDESITFLDGKNIILQSVNGPDNTIIRGNDGSNTVTLNNSPEGTTLEGFTITHESGNSGNGILNYEGYLDINNCIISNNYHNSNVEGTYYYGGGIGNINNGTMSIKRSSVSGNSGDSGGGICNYDNSILSILDCTISDNISNAWGGGIYNCENSILTIGSSNISNNIAEALYGGAIYHGIYPGTDGTLIITSSNISNNSANGTGGGIFLGCEPHEGTIIIGGEHGNDLDNFNQFTNNYKIGYTPSPEQHISGMFVDRHMDYPYNYYNPDTMHPDPPVLDELTYCPSSGIDYNLIWSDESSSGAVGYNIQESDVSNFSNILTNYNTSNTYSTYNHNMTSNTYYYYRVRARNNEFNYSGWSNTVEVMVGAVPLTSITLETRDHNNNLISGEFSYILYDDNEP